MSLQKLMNNYADYNLWANETLVNWVNTKPPEIMEQEVPSSFPTIAKTFSHLWDTEKFWLGVLQGENPPWNSFEGANDQITAGLLKQSQDFRDYVHSLSEHEMVADCILDAPWAKGKFPMYEFIQHCLNHGAYHRGQIITIARNLGITDPPMTDYNFYNMAVKGLK
jgi:uncharacterized damage-inducible protein DinB